LAAFGRADKSAGSPNQRLCVPAKHCSECGTIKTWGGVLRVRHLTDRRSVKKLLVHNQDDVLALPIIPASEDNPKGMHNRFRLREYQMQLVDKDTIPDVTKAGQYLMVNLNVVKIGAF